MAKTVAAVMVAIYAPWFLLARADLFADFAKWFLLWVILVFLYGLRNYLLWLINSYVVTDQRLIAVRYESLFKKRIMDCPLDRITHIAYLTTGVFSSLLNFGTVEIRVAGLDSPVLLEHVRKPENLKTFLWSLRTSQGNAKQDTNRYS